MLDRTKFEDSYRVSVGYQWSELTDQEVLLITRYRKLSESNRKQVRRIAGYLAETPDSE